MVLPLSAPIDPLPVLTTDLHQSHPIPHCYDDKVQVSVNISLADLIGTEMWAWFSLDLLSYAF